MKRVRPGGEKRINALGLANLHKNMKMYCQSMAENPDLLLGFEDGDYVKAAFGGEPWDRPDVIYSVAKLAPQPPHLRGCVSAFFRGSLEVWERLTTEFGEDGQISKLTEGDKENIFINATNDDNEGLLGSTRLMSRFAPRLNVSKINAKLMYSRNNTEKFIAHRMSDPLSQKYLLRLQREEEAKKLDKQQRDEEIAYQKAEVEAKKQKAARAQEKIDAHLAALAALTPQLDLETLRKGLKSDGRKITVPEIKLQLDWHRQLDFEKKMLERKFYCEMDRAALLGQLITAVEIYQKRCTVAATTPLVVPLNKVLDPLLDTPVATWDERDDMDIA
jgi:hypothetical protein